MNKQIIIGYIAINRNGEFEFDKTYKNDRGYIFFTQPIDVLRYYSIADYRVRESKFALIVTDIENIIEENGQCRSTKITFLKEQTLSDIIGDHIEWFARNNDAPVKVVCDLNSDNLIIRTVKGNYSHLAISDEDIRVSSSEEHSIFATSGMDAQIAASGDRTLIAASGECTQIAASGNFTKVFAADDSIEISSSGYRNEILSTGWFARIVASGTFARILSLGELSTIVATADDSVCTVFGLSNTISLAGKNSKFFAVSGTIVSCADFEVDGKCSGFVTGCVGQNGLKENTWYTVSNGKFVECEAQSC